MPGRGYNSLPPNTGKVFQGRGYRTHFWDYEFNGGTPEPESAWNTLKFRLFGFGILSFGTFGRKLSHFSTFYSAQTTIQMGNDKDN